MEKVKNSTVNLKNDDIQKIIGNNIRAIKEKRHLTGKEFYELIYPWKRYRIVQKGTRLTTWYTGSQSRLMI